MQIEFITSVQMANVRAMIFSKQSWKTRQIERNKRFTQHCKTLEQNHENFVYE